MIGTLRLVLFSAGVLVVLVLLLPFQLVGLLLARQGWTMLAGIVPVLFHRAVLGLAGIRLKIDGQLPDQRPLLLVSNHLSWLDIVVLGAMARLSFVAKREMRSWPVFGQLAQLQRTIFVRREKRRQSNNQANAVAERMTAREVIVLFPEGTTTDGNFLDPFKTTLFEAVRFALIASPVEKALVQPVAIDYTHLHGLPISRADRPHVAWPGEIGLIESLVPILRAGALDVTIRFGEAIPFDEDSNRKIVSAAARDSIRHMLNDGKRSTLSMSSDKSTTSFPSTSELS